MSKYEEHIYALLQEAFPYMKIVREYFVKYKGNKLYIDFYVPQLSLVIEVHGQQHYKYVDHFHRDSEGFKRYKRLDYVKAEWAHKNDLFFLELKYDSLPSSAEELICRIQEVTEEC